jgi:transposase
METLFVGIDVSKASLDVAVRPTGETWTAANAPEGIDSLVARIAALRPALAVQEATERYEAPCASAPSLDRSPMRNPRGWRRSWPGAAS